MFGESPDPASKVPYPPCPALPMPVMAGTSFSSCCAIALVASMARVLGDHVRSDRCAPRMLVPVTNHFLELSLFAVFFGRASSVAHPLRAC